MKRVELEDTVVNAQLWDTAGQERFQAITSTYYRGANGAMIVYDVTDEKSLEHTTNWYNAMKEYTNEDMPILLVGNKIDAERKVSVEDGKNQAKKLKAFYIETSAKQNDHVDEAFEQVIKAIHQQQTAPIVEKKGLKSPNLTIDIPRAEQPKKEKTTEKKDEGIVKLSDPRKPADQQQANKCAC